MKPSRRRARRRVMALGLPLLFPVALAYAGAPAGKADPMQKAIDTKNSLELGPGRLSKAAVMLNNIIKRDPNNANAHRVLAWVLIQQGKREAAKAEFEAAKAKMKPDDNDYNEVNEALTRLSPGAPAKAPEPGTAGDAGLAGGAPAPPADAGGAPAPPADAGGAPAPPADAGAPAPDAGGGVAPAPDASGAPPADAGGGAPPADPNAAPPGGGGPPLLLIGGGAGLLLLIGFLVKTFVLDKKAAAR